MDKKETDGLNNDILVANALLCLRSLENLLIAKGVFTNEEYRAEMKLVTKIITKSILQNAKVPGDLDQIVNDLDVVVDKK
jgi:hypothetical protein